MRIALAAGVLALAASLAHATKPRPPTSELDRLKREYLDGLFRAKPHLATFMGDHRFDALQPDLSEPGVKKRVSELAAQKAKLAKIDRAQLTLDDKVDADILADGIALEELYLTKIREWTWDPRLQDSFPFYDPREMVGERLGFILHGDYAPAAERRKAVAAELAALPRLIAQKKAALRSPSRIHLTQAIDDTKGLIGVFEGEVAEMTRGDKEAEAARVAAIAAARDYEKFLTDLNAKPDPKAHDWRLGAELYAAKFPLALQVKEGPAEVLPRAEAAFKTARAELWQVARKLHGELWPRAAQPADGADAKTQAQIIKKVQDELAKDHPKAAELVRAHAANLDELRAFIEKKNLLALPPRESLSVTEMPAFKRGSSAAEYLAPGILDKSKPDFHAVYYVDPVDPKWTPERVESYLRGNNSYEVQLTAAHEAYPGHHTQFFYERRDLNPLRAVLWNGAMAEGWACYGEGLMVKLGWGGAKNERFHFFDARGRMIVAANTIIDVKLQSGKMTDPEAIRFMVDEGFQEQAQAEKKLVRAKLDSTQLVQYFLGLDEIQRLEADSRKKLGAKFDQRVFDEALIGHGSLAVPKLRAFVLGE